MTQEKPQPESRNEPRFVSADLCMSESISDVPDPSLDLRQSFYLNNAKKWWKVDILLNALSALNSPVVVRSVSLLPTDSPVVYYPSSNVVEIMPSRFWNPFSYRRALARSLVYAFDNARAKVDFQNVDHVACTSIRALNISGECDLWNKWLDYIGEDPLGKDMYSMKQRCIRKKVEEHMILKSSHPSEEIRTGIDRVWERCFRDHWPFTAEPHMDTRIRDSPLRRDL
jgi:hypothetical protein